MKVMMRSPVAIKLWIVAALAALAWALLALFFASLAPQAMVPRIFQNYHIEHFAAFYLVALLGAAALPSVRLIRIGLFLGALATAFAVFRIVALIHKTFNLEDLICDFCGVLAALVPIAVGSVRRLGRQMLAG